MSIILAVEMWDELKRYVNTVDRDEAAEATVSVLVDNDYDADEIRNAFKGDSDIKKALAEYTGNLALLSEADDEEEEAEEDNDIDPDDEWEN